MAVRDTGPLQLRRRNLSLAELEARRSRSASLAGSGGSHLRSRSIQQADRRNSREGTCARPGVGDFDDDSEMPHAGHARRDS